MISLRSRLFAVALLGLLPAVATLSAQAKEKGKLNQYGNPMKIPPRPTKAAIDEADLRSRLYIFSDDSMLGRQINTIGNWKGTEYIAAEAKRLGLEPAGDNGTYFQNLPFISRYYAAESQLNVDGKTYRWGEDVVAAPGNVANATFKDVQVIYGGMAGDTTQQIAPNMAAGRFVILGAVPGSGALVAQGAAGGRGRGGAGGAGGRAVVIQVPEAGRGGARGGNPADALRAQMDSLKSEANRLLTQAAAGPLDSASRRQLQQIGQQIYNAGAAGAGGRGGGGRGAGGRGGPGGGGSSARFTGAVAVATVDLDDVPSAQRATLTAPPQRATLNNPGPAPALGSPLGAADVPVALRITRAAAEQLLGVPLATARRGAGGRTVSGRLVAAEKPSDHPEYARNVVAILRGSDPTLRAEFVAIGAHNDHNGFTSGAAVDHDSLEAFLTERYKMQMADGKTVQGTTPAMTEAALAKVNLAAIRKANGPARLDSVRNGADDDGSGSMAVLEIAEALSMAPVKPKRSVIFVWHEGEESGLQGSAYFTNHPTIPRESIVAQINIDMIGRGRADDLPGGGPDYLGVVGSNRLSSDLAKMVSDANKKQKSPLKLDYQFDDSTSWSGYNNIYGRSDHYNYARYNIPIAFFFTGLHRDYHQFTDEAQYIDYPHYTRITNYIRDLMVDVANNPQRPRVDKGPSM